MQINLNSPVTITVSPNTMALILDTLAKGLPYNVGKQIIEGEILPQLMGKEEKRDGNGNMDSTGGVCGESGSSGGGD